MTDKKATANNTFAIGGVSHSTDRFVVKRNAVFRIRFSGK